MTKIKIAALSMASALVLPVHATTLIYEGFAYGLMDGTTMDGVATNATGLSGNYALGQSLAGIGAATFTSAGLSFGSNFKPVSGGALSMSITSNVNNTTRSAQLGAVLNAGTVTGTVYTSYLFSVGSTGTPAGTSQVRINGAQTTSLNQHFSVLGDGTLVGSNSLQYGTETVKNGPTGILSLNTTYLALAKFTELGTVGSTGTGEMWVLTEAGYNDWLVFGGGLEANLTTYAVAGSHLTTSQTTTANNATFSNSQFLSFAVSNASNTLAQSMIVDELRWGNTLGDAVNIVAVPEPTTGGAIIAGGLIGLVALRRARTGRSA